MTLHHSHKNRQCICAAIKQHVMCFVEFTREVTDVQMPDVAPVILPQMYKIFTMAEVLYSALKHSAVHAFEVIVCKHCCVAL